ncbi:MAG TPA: hypothetical protein O0X92_06380, partial [Methanocorpusculum sp.]|nr:hypothetical protein [Methanocorpusculum sp.]
CANINDADKIQKLFSNNYFRVYTNNDVIGAEFGAALKNIIAIGAGALQGLGYHDNARAALITRGLAEIRRLGVAFGANPMTFIGLHHGWTWCYLLDVGLCSDWRSNEFC